MAPQLPGRSSQSGELTQYDVIDEPWDDDESPTTQFDRSKLTFLEGAEPHAADLTPEPMERPLFESPSLAPVAAPSLSLTPPHPHHASPWIRLYQTIAVALAFVAVVVASYRPERSPRPLAHAAAAPVLAHAIQAPLTPPPEPIDLDAIQLPPSELRPAIDLPAVYIESTLLAERRWQAELASTRASEQPAPMSAELMGASTDSTPAVLPPFDRDRANASLQMAADSADGADLTTNRHQYGRRNVSPLGR
jgi:hypothetical protein